MDAEQTASRHEPGPPRHPAVLAWLRLACVYQKIDRATAEHLRPWDLSVAQFDVLAQLGSAEEITQQELADRLLVTKGNASQLLARMEARGLVARRPEGRTLRLSLTATGRRLYDAAVPAQEALVAARFGALTADEQAQLLHLLRVLDRGIA